MENSLLRNLKMAYDCLLSDPRSDFRAVHTRVEELQNGLETNHIIKYDEKSKPPNFTKLKIELPGIRCTVDCLMAMSDPPA